LGTPGWAAKASLGSPSPEQAGGPAWPPKPGISFPTGRTVLSSFPTSLGIDLFGRCNIHPACVYCPWDEMKKMETGRTEETVDDATLRGYGPFFLSARYLINCSLGEPLLHPRLDAVLGLLARRALTA